MGREEFDVQGLCQRLGKELDRTVGQLEAVDKIVKNSNEEKRQLMDQLQETIGSYTEAIEKLHQQLANAKGGTAKTLQLQLHEERAVNQRLQLEANDVKNALEEEQRQAPQQSGNSEAEALQSEIARLKGSIRSLAGEVESHSQRDHNRSEEL